MKSIGIQLIDDPKKGEILDLKIEPVLDQFTNLIISGLVVDHTLNQNQVLILIANQGEFKCNPTIGVAIDELILSNDFLKFRHRIREHFAKDGLKVRDIELSEGKPLNIDASYE